MSGRKWFVRGLVFTIVGGILCAAYLYRLWTNPTAVRQQVLVNLGYFFPGGEFTLDSAYLRLLGGVVLRDLRLSRRDDPAKLAFTHIPFAVVYHDKEKLLGGKLCFRKIEMQQLRMEIKRDREGKWNVSGITGPMRPDFLIPTMVVRQGVLIFEDEFAGLPPTVLSNVDLTIINDPLTTVTIEGIGVADFGGSVVIKGAWNRVSHEMVVSIAAREVPVTTTLLHRFTPACAVESTKNLYVEGMANINADLAYLPDTDPPFRYDVRGTLAHGKIEHPQLPLPLTEVSATLRATDGELQLQHARARSGPAELTAKGTGALLCCKDNFEGTVEIKHVQLGKALFARLPAELQCVYKYFEPEGPATVRLDCARRDGLWSTLSSGLNSRLTVQPEGITIAFLHYPYPLGHVTGRLDYDLETGKIDSDVVGKSRGQPVNVSGYWKHVGERIDANFDLAADNIDLHDDQLATALPDGLEKLARSFHPVGKGDIRANFRKRPEDDEFRNIYQLKFHQTAVQWDEFPYTLESISGRLDVYPEHWEFRDFRGKHGAGEVCLHGRYLTCEPTALKVAPEHRPPGRLSLEISATNIRLDDELRTAFLGMPTFVKAWDAFVPAGQVNFKAHVDRPLSMTGGAAKKADLEGLDIDVDVRGCAITPKFLPYRLNDLSGQFKLNGTRLVMDQVTARHDASQFSLERGVVDLRLGGGFYADLQDLRANPMVPNEDFLKALPAKLELCWRQLELQQPFALQTRVICAQSSDTGSEPDIYWDGQLWLKKTGLRTGLQWSDIDGTLGCAGRYDGNTLRGVKGNLYLERASLLKQPFQNVHARFEIKEKTPDVLTVDLRAPIFNGDVAGQARFELDSKMRYEVNLTASQIDLEKFSKHNFGSDPDLHGFLMGRLHLTGKGGDVATLDGNGSVDVPRGRLYNLPLLLDLLKFLGLRWPDRTAFEEAHASFNINGTRVAIRELDLLGNAVSVAGKGELNLDGTDVELDFYPSWARVEQLLPQVVRAVPVQISKNLIKIEMRGKIGSQPSDFRFTKKPLPVLVEPFMKVRNRTSGENQQPGVQAPEQNNADANDVGFMKAFQRLTNYRRTAGAWSPARLTSQQQ